MLYENNNYTVINDQPVNLQNSTQPQNLTNATSLDKIENVSETKNVTNDIVEITSSSKIRKIPSEKLRELEQEAKEKYSKSKDKNKSKLEKNYLHKLKKQIWNQQAIDKTKNAKPQSETVQKPIRRKYISQKKLKTIKEKAENKYKSYKSKNKENLIEKEKERLRKEYEDKDNSASSTETSSIKSNSSSCYSLTQGSESQVRVRICLFQKSSKMGKIHVFDSFFQNF